MDPVISWLQPEQEGPAKTLWLRIFQTQQQDFDGANAMHSEVDSDVEIALPNGAQPTGNSHIGKQHNGKYLCDKFSATLNNRKRKVDQLSNQKLTSTKNAYNNNQYGGCPWRQENFDYGPGVIGLHQEIEHFFKYMSPTATEHCVRGDVISRIERIILSKWPEANVAVFGSYRTGLYLPTSDIDLVVIGKWSESPLRTLEQEFLDNDIAQENSIRVLDKASVPIVKLTDKRTEIKVDISFNMSNSVKSAELIKQYMVQYPVLIKLVYVLKQFLLERDLNEVFTGGISSYSLILMCISFLQRHPRQESLLNCNLGVLLIEFFELYGRNFNYITTAIRVRDGGDYVTKEKIQKEMADGHRTSLLCIEDPLQPSNDIGRSSYGALQVKRAFDHAFTVLSNCLNPLSPFRLGPPFLGRIVRVTGKVIQYRKWLQQTFGSLYESPVITNNSSTSSPSSDSSSSMDDAEALSEAAVWTDIT